jgi:hypothetical protein
MNSSIGLAILKEKIKYAIFLPLQKLNTGILPFTLILQSIFGVFLVRYNFELS